MRIGSLPPELQGLHTEPSAAISAAEFMEREMQRKLRLSLRRKTKATEEMEPIARSLVKRFDHTEDQISALKKTITESQTMYVSHLNCDYY